jgi:hypothetical protein
MKYIGGAVKKYVFEYPLINSITLENMLLFLYTKEFKITNVGNIISNYIMAREIMTGKIKYYLTIIII